MASYRLAAFARRQIAQILADSEVNFGAAARQRYSRLLQAAFENIAANPEQPLVAWRTVRRMRLGVYHIRHSRKHVPGSIGRVAEPRHLVVFRIADDSVTDILGLMHERMLRSRALSQIARTAAAPER